LATGTSLTNRAAIYFDQNLPIVTNTVLNTVNNTVSSHPLPLLEISDSTLLVGEPLLITDASDCAEARLLTTSDGASTINSTLTHSFSTDGVYTVNLRVLQGGRVNTTQRNVYVGTAALPHTAKALLAVLPNPTTGQFRLQAGGGTHLPQGLQVQLLNLHGQPIAVSTHQTNLEVLVVHPLVPLPAGVYLVQMVVPGQPLITQRLVVQP
jgi:hypothetical protein